MMSATIFWRDRPWGNTGGLTGVVLSGILKQLGAMYLYFRVILFLMLLYEYLEFMTIL